MSLIESICKNIYPLDTRFMEQAQARQDRLIKPQGSLGKLEEISIQLAGIYGSKYFDTTKKIVLSFACDHGVYEEGVAPNNQNITLLQSMNFPKKINGVGTISKFVGSDVQLVDVGINCDEPIEGVIDCKIRKSTSNMAKGPAMTRQEAIRAIEIGIEMSEKYIQEDYKVIGIGEIGLDYHYGTDDKQLQKDVLIDQIKLADKLHLPIVIHVRDAIGDLIEILKDNIKYINNGGIIHCFNESIESYRILKGLGFKFSFGGAITFSNSKNAPRLLKEVDLNDILLETDSPYLTPEPLRGKERNQPKYVKYVAERIAQYKDVDVDTIINANEDNIKQVFKKIKG